MDDLTLEKLKIVEQLHVISQNQAVMKEQMDGFKVIHEGVQKILDRHDLMLFGDGSVDKTGVNSRIKVLEDDMGARITHQRVIYTGIIGLIVEHIRHLFLGK